MKNRNNIIEINLFAEETHNRLFDLLIWSPNPFLLANLFEPFSSCFFVVPPHTSFDWGFSGHIVIGRSLPFAHQLPHLSCCLCDLCHRNAPFRFSVEAQKIQKRISGNSPTFVSFLRFAFTARSSLRRFTFDFVWWRHRKFWLMLTFNLKLPSLTWICDVRVQS